MLAQLLHGGLAVCTRFVPSDSPHHTLYAALICGVNVPEGFAKTLFVDCGLIHILVVSGAHLVFIERGLVWVPRSLRLFVLLAYCWLTDWGAPVVRAFVARVVRPWTNGRGASALESEVVVTVATLLLHPPWIWSRSFLMSWLCVVALTAPGLPRRGRTLAESVRVYVLLYPYSLSAPLTIAWNCVVAPAVGRVMFPAALAAMLCPPLVVVVDLLWDALLWVLEHGPRFARGPALIQLDWIWWIPWATHGLLIYGEWAWRRERAFS